MWHVKPIVVGAGSHIKKLELLAGNIEVANRMHILGFRRDVVSLLNACDLFYPPFLRECLPVSLIEAYATGTPCLASGAKGYVDALEAAGGASIVRTFSSVDCANEIEWKTVNHVLGDCATLREHTIMIGLETVMLACQQAHIRVLSERAA